MTATVDLIVFGEGAPPATWPHGRVHQTEATPVGVSRATDRALEDAPEAIMWWDSALGPVPDPGRLLDQPDDAWHGGLLLGQTERPRRLAHVAPTWMLAADADPTTASSSWRVSLRACVARTDVVRTIGGPDSGYDSLAGAGLDLGHRWITHGARCRHDPRLLAGCSSPTASTLAEADEVRFVHRRFGHRWAAVSVAVGPRRIAALRALRRVRAEPRPTAMDLVPPPVPAPHGASTVSVVIPTVDRYEWLDTVLGQLAEQTMLPTEVIVVDQTDETERRPVTAEGLPLEVIIAPAPGQSTARNLALARATGDLILFVDDDDEIEPDLIARHVAVLEHRRVDVSSGVAPEPGDPPPTPEFSRFRVADVFPTNNSMVRRDALDRSGWFDPAFDHGVRADHELGTRLYLSGARMVLSPDIEVVHHRAPSGGLRRTGARRVTNASSRRSIVAREPIAATEIHLWRRHHPRRVGAAIALRLAGNLVGAGSTGRRFARAVVQALLLPVAAGQAFRAARQADRLAEAHPAPPRPRTGMQP